MESYDNDGLLLFLDDDLFPAEPEEETPRFFMPSLFLRPFSKKFGKRY